MHLPNRLSPPVSTLFCPATIGCVIAFVLLVVSPQLLAQEEPTLPDLSDSQLQQLHSGEVHVELDQGDSINRGVVIGIVQEPINNVTPLIARCWEYADWRDSVPESSLEETIDRNNVVCGGSARIPFPGRNRHGHFHVHNRSTDVEGTRSYVSNFDYVDDSGNLEDMFGYWVAYPYGPDNEHTMVKHVLNVDIGGWLPDALVRWATRRTLPNTVLGIRTELDDSLTEPNFWNDYDYQ